MQEAPALQLQHSRHGTERVFPDRTHPQGATQAPCTASHPSSPAVCYEVMGGAQRPPPNREGASLTGPGWVA